MPCHNSTFFLWPPTISIGRLRNLLISTHICSSPGSGTRINRSVFYHQQITDNVCTFLGCVYHVTDFDAYRPKPYLQRPCPQFLANSWFLLLNFRLKLHPHRHTNLSIKVEPPLNRKIPNTSCIFFIWLFMKYLKDDFHEPQNGIKLYIWSVEYYLHD